ncbi:MAG: PAS domain S-box protein [Candidatus Aminicenantales bacterium]
MDKIRILIVEDEVLVARDIRNVVKILGYEVVGTVSNGEEALKKMSADIPDLVLIDIGLRGRMDGVELAERVRRTFSRPVIYLTALSDEDTMQRAKVTEPFGFIFKPFEQKELHTAIEMALYKHKMEIKIRESEERYRNLFENAVEGIFQKSPEGRFIVANPAMTRILGYSSPEELISGLGDIKSQIYVHEEIRLEFGKLIEKQGEVRNFEYQGYRKDGSIVWISENVRTVKDSEGNLLYYEGTAQDITERKKAEELIQAQRDLAFATSDTDSLKKALFLCLETAIRISEMDCGGIYLMDESTGALELVAHQRLSPEFIESVSLYDKNSPSTQLIAAGNPIYVQYPNPEISLDETHQQEGLRAIAVVPILHEKQVIGCINIASHTVSEVSVFSRDALEAIAAQIGSSIAHLHAKELLKESEKRFRELWDNAPVAYHTLDTEGHITQVNQTEAKMLGYQPHEMVGRSIFDFILPEQREEARKRFQQKISEKFVAKAENRIYLKKDGSQVHVSIDDILERDNSGQITGIRSTMVDITERRKAENALRESEAKYASVVEQAIDGIVIVQDGLIQFANAALGKLIGYDTKEIMGRPVVDYIHPKDREMAIQRIQDRIAGKKFQGLSELRILSKDGSEKYIQASGTLIQYAGKPADLIFLRDVTEYKQAEEEIHRREQEVRTIADNVPALVSYVDAEGRYRFVNRRYEEWFGMPKEEILGKKLSRVLGKNASRLIKDHVESALSGQRVHFEEAVKYLHGQERWVVADYVPDKEDNGKVKGFFALISDISDHKRAEQALQESEARYKELADSIGDLFFAMDKDLRYIFWNKASEKFTGISREEAIGKSLYDIFPAIKGAKVDRIYREVLRTQKPQSFINRFQFQGRQIFFEISAYPSKYGLSVYAKDITERQRVERERKLSEEKFRNIFNSVGEGIVYANRRGVVLEVNPAFIEITGIPQDELIGQPGHKLAKKFLKGKDLARTLKNIRSIVSDKPVKPFEIRFRNRRLEMSGAKAGEHQGITAFVQDVTERKQAEEALISYAHELRQLSNKLIRAQEAERARISRELHDEMGQSLTMFRINLASIKKSLDSEQLKKVKDKLNDVDGFAEEMMEQIHELTLDLRPHMLDDLGLLPTVKWYADRLARRLNIKLQFTQKNWKGRIDPDRTTALFRIVQEALTNVVKHAQAKKVKIHMVQNRANFETVIEDDGRGFSQNRRRSRRSRKYGTGITGMKERAALVGGTCTVISRPGKGTRVRIVIPKRDKYEKDQIASG